MEETYRLIGKAQAGDKASRDTLVKDNQGLIWSVVRRFQNRGYDLDDLFQIGAIGMLKCIDKFDVSFKVRFSTYAVPMIMGEIKRFLRDDGMLKVSRPLKEMAVHAKQLEEQILHETGVSPTLSELAVALDTEVEELVLALESHYEVRSLYAPVQHQDGAPMYLMDRIEDDEQLDEKMIDHIALREIINDLPQRDQMVIKMRYFEDKTQDQVAKAIGVSQVQVSRIEKKVIESIRASFTASP